MDTLRKETTIPAGVNVSGLRLNSTHLLSRIGIVRNVPKSKSSKRTPDNAVASQRGDSPTLAGETGQMLMRTGILFGEKTDFAANIHVESRPLFAQSAPAKGLLFRTALTLKGPGTPPSRRYLLFALKLVIAAFTRVL